MMQGNTVYRRINFYRVYAGQDDGGNLLPFDPAPGLNLIKTLRFVDGQRYRTTSDGVITCCWPDEVGQVSKVRVGTIRRFGLPQLERKGELKPIEADSETGIAEETHMVFFRNGVIGAEFNFYGPRVSRFKDYFNDRCRHLLSQPIAIDSLFRDDVIAQLANMRGVKLFEMKIRASEANLVEQADHALGQAFKSAGRATNADVIEISMRARRNGFLPGIEDFVRRLRSHGDVLESAKKLRVVGIDDRTGQPKGLDLLNDCIVAKRAVVRSSARGRAVDRNSAYSAIVDAYREMKQQINAAAVVRLESGG